MLECMLKHNMLKHVLQHTCKRFLNILVVIATPTRLEAAGYHLPTVEVRYKELIVETDAVVGTTTLPTIINGYKDMARSLVGALPFVKLGAGAKRPVRVLKALTGVLKPVRW